MKTIITIIFIIAVSIIGFGQDTTDNKSNIIDTKELKLFVENNKKVFTKDEFETKAEFFQRLFNFMNSSEYKDKVFATISNFDYDAESQTFTLYIDNSQNGIPRAELINADKIEFLTLRDSYSLSFEMPATKARMIKPQLKTEIIGIPIGIERIQDILKIIPLKITVKNSESGEIYLELYKNNGQKLLNPISKPNETLNTSSASIIVLAKSGETVAKLAQRYNVNATEVAKMNGLLPTSVLSEGRKVLIPKK